MRRTLHSPAIRSPSERLGGAARPWPAWRGREARRIESALRAILRRNRAAPLSLHRAMVYSLFPGGKRLRPALVVLGHRACSGRHPEIYRLAACAELVHTFTLIHDDLPCMDDDDFRRGRPSSHKVFGEALAVLAGDALLNLAYQVIASLRCDARLKERVLTSLSSAVGIGGVLGGQVADIEAEGMEIPEARLRKVHLQKTASLFVASLVLGGDLAGGGKAELDRLRLFGRDFGLLFQIVDDLLNVEGTPVALGRPAGSDERHRKATYPRIVGLELSRQRMTRLAHSAQRTAAGMGWLAPVFSDLVRTVLARLPRPDGEER